MIKEAIAAFVGLAGGLSVGGGFVAFLSVLGIVPRLTQLTKTVNKISYYEWAIVLGALFGCLISLWKVTYSFFPAFLIPIGLMYGIFIGMLAAALTEVTNVLPILAKRIGVDDQIVWLLMAIVIGKVAGSLFHWMYFARL
ncbi:MULTISPECIES: stage V sporulation protein AB [Bacillus]|jgi:stage V sporulation protein AB|uniref:Stage V sporulation protein AB n=1 Tax=Bacillus smithii 7_3_47FAA TaxID=665952 RepID=G9QPD2_9BACI|nr:stage V sporulation protein AB [Bacillus smithii]AKP47657.1 Stage V sporulation protein AB SpoVAB [Bacillus smithii]EHL73925.1 hypothetical protein HMPREF1015_00149 [Bacillus smithii 7_3_47FAA]MED0658564.1 stage V sporulation protein AB [Bacillus smithii]MED1418971.1 stage V sporulation protein AB [Bacillus smithii]MED1455227.1 stage V sporulation protein AB [Bacillus smithii]